MCVMNGFQSSEKRNNLPSSIGSDMRHKTLSTPLPTEQANPCIAGSYRKMQTPLHRGPKWQSCRGLAWRDRIDHTRWQMTTEWNDVKQQCVIDWYHCATRFQSVPHVVPSSRRIRQTTYMEKRFIVALLYALLLVCRQTKWVCQSILNRQLGNELVSRGKSMKDPDLRLGFYSSYVS